MTVVYLDNHSRLKAYSASVKGAKSIVKIEIECDEPGSLGHLLEELGQIQRTQDAVKKAAAAAIAKAKTREKFKALPAPLLQIEDMRGYEP